MMPRAEIIAIGNEVLQGDVQDTNTHWLCRQIAGRGARVERAVIVRDEPPAIADALHASLARRPALLITCGGLGPTVDDLTLAAIGAALGRPLAEHPQALQLVADAYRRFAAQGSVAHAEMTPERRKMACLPQGAEPLHNPVGGAPGVLLRLDASVLVCLPGVPEEMKGIFTTSLTPTLAATLGNASFYERRVVVDCGDESVMAPVVNRVTAAFPHVYIKSRARVYGSGSHLHVTLSAAGAAAQAQAAVQGAEDVLVRALTEAGIGVLAREDVPL